MYTQMRAYDMYLLFLVAYEDLTYGHIEIYEDLYWCRLIFPQAET